MISLNDVLLAMSNIPVDDPIAEIWGCGLQGGDKIIEYTGALPIAINANGDVLIDYQIYGADGGVGEPTENLIRQVSTTQRVYLANQKYCLSKYVSVPTTGNKVGIVVYDANDVIIFNDYIGAWKSLTYDNTSGQGAYADITISYLYGGVNASFVVGASPNTAVPYPANYIPYGYKLPMMATPKNLFDKNAKDVDKGYVPGKVFGADGSLGYSSLYSVSEYMQVEPLKEYFLEKFHNPAWQHAYGCACFYDSDKNVLSVISASDKDSLILLAPELARFIRISVYFPTCKFYSSAPQKENVYIGENQLDSVEGVADYVDKASGKIVRMIGEYTFTGDESFNKYGNSDAFYTSKTIDPVGITTVNTTTMRCDHPAFTAIENKDTRYWLNPEADDICCFLPGGMSQVFLRSSSNFATSTECKAYLKDQYDNGTPVKISYWLKTPIEEDPPVSFPDIPTIKGETVIDYDGDPKPSQMYVKYKGKG